MKLRRKLMALWIAAVLLNLLWGATIILQGGTLEDAKAATAPMKIVFFVLGGMTVLALVKGEGEPLKHDERTLKLSGVAFRYSWLGIMMTVAALIGIEAYYPAKLIVPQVLSIIYAAVLVIPFVLLWYFERKGDVK